jgi:hypothetical protein
MSGASIIDTNVNDTLDNEKMLREKEGCMDG